MDKKFCTQYDKIDLEQRRKFIRIAPHTHIYVNNFNTISNKSFEIIQCRMINISANGLVFNVNVDFAENDYIQTIFKLKETVFNLKSKIIRKYINENSGYNYGVEFYVIKDSVRDSLSKCIKTILNSNDFS
ncbi:MAG: PilZ domain-containing protein [Candidatus Muirbacterium halophilum]|nr:PilZ domain-containing protein [Candidatus Muirbacterium halophilum]